MRGPTVVLYTRDQYLENISLVFANQRKTDSSLVAVVGDVCFSVPPCADPCQVEFCVVRMFKTDVSEELCFPFQARTPKSNKPVLGKVSRPTSSLIAPSFPAVANLVSSKREDDLGKMSGVVAISKVVRVGIHPQEKLNNTFNVF